MNKAHLIEVPIGNHDNELSLTTYTMYCYAYAVILKAKKILRLLTFSFSVEELGSGHRCLFSECLHLKISLGS
jgi:hypothetical protein